MTIPAPSSSRTPVCGQLLCFRGVFRQQLIKILADNISHFRFVSTHFAAFLTAGRKLCRCIQQAASPNPRS